MMTNGDKLAKYEREIKECSKRKPSKYGRKIDPDSHRIPGEFIYCGMTLPGFANPLATNEVDFVGTDVLLACHPKTGTTLTQEIIYISLHDGDTEKANKEYNFMRVPLLERVSPDHRNGIRIFRKAEHPRLLKTHLPFSCMPEQLVTKKIRTIYVMRNPKDTLVSYYYFHKSASSLGKFEGLWSDFFELFLMQKLCYGDIFDHYLSWWEQRGRANIIIIKYEDLVLYPKREISKIATFCGKGHLTDATIEKIAEATSFENMKANQKTNYTSIPHNIDCAVSPFMRRGSIGDWKNHFTIAQNEKMDMIIEERLGRKGLEFIYEV